jgi:hypothetical protein
MVKKCKMCELPVSDGYLYCERHLKEKRKEIREKQREEAPRTLSRRGTDQIGRRDGQSAHTLGGCPKEMDPQ